MNIKWIAAYPIFCLQKTTKFYEHLICPPSPYHFSLNETFKWFSHFDEAKQPFKIFDRNDDGMIDIDELVEVIKELDLEEDPTKVEQVLNDLDKNRDGLIDDVEFGRLLGI